jgi:hypothetical protein
MNGLLLDLPVDAARAKAHYKAEKLWLNALARFEQVLRHRSHIVHGLQLRNVCSCLIMALRAASCVVMPERVTVMLVTFRLSSQNLLARCPQCMPFPYAISRVVWWLQVQQLAASENSAPDAASPCLAAKPMLPWHTTAPAEQSGSAAQRQRRRTHERNRQDAWHDAMLAVSVRHRLVKLLPCCRPAQASVRSYTLVSCRHYSLRILTPVVVRVLRDHDGMQAAFKAQPSVCTALPMVHMQCAAGAHGPALGTLRSLGTQGDGLVSSDVAKLLHLLTQLPEVDGQASAAAANSKQPLKRNRVRFADDAEPSAPGAAALQASEGASECVSSVQALLDILTVRLSAEWLSSA